MMKLRVKLGRASQTVDLEGREPTEVTLGELKTLVASTFGLENHDFDLSLNKTDALNSDDQDLSTFGIVSGDLLHLIGSNLPQISPPRQDRQQRQPLSSYSGSSMGDPVQQSSDVSMVTVHSSVSSTQHNENERNINPDDTGQPEPTPGSRDDQDMQINRFLLEPLVVRESTATQVPALLEQLYLSESLNCSADAVWVVLHTLMLESGFTPQQVTNITEIPPGWKQSGFYKCSYLLTGTSSGQCSVVGVVVGSSLIVHGLVGSESSFKTEQLQLKTSDHVNVLSQDVPDVYVGLDRLSRQFKDTISLPLENELAVEAGVPGGQGFTSLPYEVKIRILSSLDAMTLCHFAQTRSDMAAVAKDKSLWRRLYIRDFGRPENNALTRDWYELYKDMFRQRQEEERRRRQFRLEQTERLFGFPGAFRPHPNPGLIFPPHMIGGDHDLNPEFAAGGIPNPMGQGRRPGPILPNIGIPSPLDRDPLGMGSGMGSLGLPSRPGRGNLTGSPFSGGRGMFRSPFM